MDCNRALQISPIGTCVFTSICLAGSLATAAANNQDTVAAVVADQVRSQGFPCRNPSSADRIQAESAPNQTAYLLKCEGATYRVLLIPDQAAEVARVD